MTAVHLEFLVEDLSTEVFLASLLPRMIGDRVSFSVHSHQGKDDMLNKLLPRLRAYSKWLPSDNRIILVIDRDSADCTQLKSLLEDHAASANLISRRVAEYKNWQVVSRISIEELEAWYFGAWSAVVSAYPGVPLTVPAQAAYRDCDSIAGGTWEALERILQRSNHFRSGLRKLELARAVGEYFDWATCSSRSFIAFRDAIFEAIEPAV